MIRLFDIILHLGESDGLIPQKISELLGVSERDVKLERIVKKSLDARRTRPARFIYVVDITLPDEQAVMNRVGQRLKWRTAPAESTAAHFSHPHKIPKKRPIIIGSGPAGLFSALTLASQGVPVLLLERGKPVHERVADIDAFWKRGVFNRESNVQFGEGGAGTFSDGKLTTRLREGNIAQVKRIFVELGAPPEIESDGKPHIGTDKLREVVGNFRERLIGLGCEMRFNARVTDIIVNATAEGQRLFSVVVDERDEIETDHLILAIGQSASDTYQKLFERGVGLAAKPFAMGLRVEHPQELIDRIQYGKWRHQELPPANYFLSANIAGLERGVYTFCMCPGGQIIGCSSAEEEVVTNGMSLYRRDNPYADSAVVVNIRTDDFAGKSPLEGIAFRREWEQRAFHFGGRNYRAPAQRLTDFVEGKESADIAPCSFKPGVTIALLEGVLPSYVCKALRRGLILFNEKMPGFLTAEATLVGVETRTSSPVRVLRGEDGQSTTVRGLYPCGEGSGYAGGIMSSALDGIRAAQHILDDLAGG